MDSKNNALAEYEPPKGAGRGITALKELDFKQMMYVGDLMFQARMFDDLKSAAQAQIKVMAGQELGLAPMQSMNAFHIIKGRVTMAANTMAAKVLESGRYRFNVDTITDDIVTINFYALRDNKWVSIGMSSFTKEDAVKAGTQNMGKFPRNMLYARAIANGVRWFCPDVFSAPVYDEYDQIETIQPAGEGAETVEQIEERRAAEKQSRREHAAKAGSRRTAAKVEAQTPKEPAPEPETAKAAPVAQETQLTPGGMAPEANGDASYEADELDRMDLGELSDMSDEMGLEDTNSMTADQLRVAIRNASTGGTEEAHSNKGAVEAEQAKNQVEGAPETYMTPPPLPPKPTEPEVETIGFDDEEEIHTPEQRKRVMAMLNELGFKDDNDKRAIVAGLLGLKQVISFTTVTKAQAVKLIDGMTTNPGEDPATKGAALRGMFIDLGAK